MDSRTFFWMQKFGVASRTRPASMVGLASINPVDVITLCEKLRWPCTFDEAVSVLIGMDDTYRELNQPSK